MFKSVLVALIASVTARPKKVDGPLAEITHKTWMDISRDDVPIGRLTFGLYGKEVPKTVENFRTFCRGDTPQNTIDHLYRWPAHYRGVIFHSIFEGFAAETGDVQFGTGNGGLSIYKNDVDFGMFNDEKLDLKHTKRHLLTMANKGKNMNNSNFMITFDELPFLDGKNVIFGEVIDGFDVVAEIEKNSSVEGKQRPDLGTVDHLILVADAGEVTEDGEYKQFVPFPPPKTEEEL